MPKGYFLKKRCVEHRGFKGGLGTTHFKKRNRRGGGRPSKGANQTYKGLRTSGGQSMGHLSFKGVPQKKIPCFLRAAKIGRRIVGEEMDRGTRVSPINAGK